MKPATIICTQLEQDTLVDGMALIESFYEHVQDETSFVVMTDDSAISRQIAEMRLPQVKSVSLAEAGVGAGLRSQRAVALVHHLQSPPQTGDEVAPVLYVEPRSFFVGPLPSPEGDAGLRVRLGETPGAEQLVALFSDGSEGARAKLASLGATGASGFEQLAGLSGVSLNFCDPDGEVSCWLIATLSASLVSYECLVVCRRGDPLPSGHLLRQHGASYADFIMRGLAWSHAVRPEVPENVSADAIAEMSAALIPSGVRDIFLERADSLELNSERLGADWDLFIHRDIPKPQMDRAAPQRASHMPYGSRLPASYSKPTRPAESIRVSALVSTYAAERYIEDCLVDLTSQTLFKKGELEIVVIDSASPEDERSVVDDFMQKHSNITYLRTPEREGVYMAWNRAARLARGSYLCNANTDDRHRYDALEVLANALDEHPEVGLVYGDCLMTTQPNRGFSEADIDGRLAWPAFTRDCLLNGCMIGPQPMWRRRLHDVVGYFDARYRVAADYEMWLRITQHMPAMHVGEVLGLYLHEVDGVEQSNAARCQAETLAIRAMYQRRARRHPDPHQFPYNYVRQAGEAERAIQARYAPPPG